MLKLRGAQTVELIVCDGAAPLELLGREDEALGLYGDAFPLLDAGLRANRYARDVCVNSSGRSRSIRTSLHSRILGDLLPQPEASDKTEPQC